MIWIWTEQLNKFEITRRLNAAGVPASAVNKPGERIDQDPNTGNFGLWPSVRHTRMGEVRVDGQPVHFSKTDWTISRGAPCLGEHTQQVLTELLGRSNQEVDELREEGVI